MDIRPITQDDRQDLINLVSMMIYDENRTEVAGMIVDDFYSNPLFCTYVSLENGCVNGYIAYKKEPFEGSNGVAEVVFLGVSKEFRRAGYGQRLIDFVENTAANDGIRKLYIKTSPENIRAVSFWINMGYEFEARLKDFSLPGKDAYLLGKCI